MWSKTTWILFEICVLKTDWAKKYKYLRTLIVYNYCIWTCTSVSFICTNTIILNIISHDLQNKLLNLPLHILYTEVKPEATTEHKTHSDSWAEVNSKIISLKQLFVFTVQRQNTHSNTDAITNAAFVIWRKFSTWMDLEVNLALMHREDQLCTQSNPLPHSEVNVFVCLPHSIEQLMEWLLTHKEITSETRVKLSGTEK